MTLALFGSDLSLCICALFGIKRWDEIVYGDKGFLVLET